MKFVIAIPLIILLTSCRNDKHDTHLPLKDSIPLAHTKKHPIESVSPGNDSVLLADLYQFAMIGKKVDTMLGNMADSIYYCKIGNFLISGKKTALLIHGSAVELYIYKNDNPIKEDSIAVRNLDYKSEFEVTYDDYNFDGQKDIYIQRTISNGRPISMGCLITLNKSSHKLQRHDECDNLENMKPDPKRKVVITDLTLDCDTPGKEDQLCKVLNKWAGTKLIPLKSHCHCK